MTPSTRARLDALLQPADPERKVEEAVELSLSASAAINMLRDDPVSRANKPVSTNLTMDPFEKYDMTFNVAVPTPVLSTSLGKYAGQDNAWVAALVQPVILEFDKTIIKFPNIRRFVGGGSNDLIPDLQHPENPATLVKTTAGRGAILRTCQSRPPGR